MKNLTKILAICLVSFQNEALAAKEYWWMNDPSVFGGSGASSNLVQKPTNVNQPQSPPEQKYQNPPPVQQPQGIQTECPSGTKCVADFFCNENAIMVNYRVSLTAAQKRQRGSLTSCVLGGDLGVCCSTAQSNGGSAASNLPIRSQQQTAAAEPVAAAPEDYDSDAEVVNIPTGSCPEMSELPPIEACQGKNSTCWSVGLPDVDCVDNALCCFDGCVNACFNTNMDTPEPPPLTTPSPDAKSAPEPTTPASKPPKEQETIPPEQVAQASNEVEKKVPAPEPTTTPKPYTTTPKPITPKPTTPKPATAKPRPPMPMERQAPNPIVNEILQPAPQAQGGGGRQPYTGPEASEAKPHVMCPAAMLCVPRETCDFKGFITEQTLSLSPQLEMLRVPLINCVNPDNQNIDVCCRDPNYVDPWPQGMMMNGNMNGGGKQMSQPMAMPAPAPQPAPQPAPAPAQPAANELGLNPRVGQQTRRKGGYGKK